MKLEFDKDVEQKDVSQKPSKTKIQQRRYYHKPDAKEELVRDEPQPKAETAEEAGITPLMEDAQEEKTVEATAFSEQSVRAAPRAEIKEAPKEVKKKQRKRIYQEEQKKQKARIHFDDEPGLSPSGEVVTPMIGATGRKVNHVVHQKVDESEDENSAVEAAHRSEELAENTAAKLQSEIRNRTSSNRTSGSYTIEKEESQRSSKLQFESHEPKEAASKKASSNHELQKKRYKREYASGKKSGSPGKNSAGTAATKAGKAKRREEVAERMLAFAKRHKGFLAVLLVVAVIVVQLVNMLAAGGSLLAGSGMAVVQSTYLASDDEIYGAENYYAAMEDALQAQIDNIKQTYPGYDEYNFQVDEISHNPYQLTSYLTVKYGNYKARDVKDDLKEVFQEQYHLKVEGSTQTVTDTRTVRVGESLGSVVTSGYCNCTICCGRWSGGPTASGAMPTSNHTIAVDASNPIVPMGTKVVMNGVEYTVEDTGNFARYGVAFDVYYDSHSAASAHGHKTWEAYLSDANGNQTVEVTQTRTVKVLNVTLKNSGFDLVARNRLETTEAISWYNLLNASFGNRDYLWDTAQFSGYQPGGMSYEIPPEALSDERFKNMIMEAEKYLGYPYVWGGSSPSTSFDCSGFVSWVINHCGNGWDYGRRGAEGLRGLCTYVSPNEAKPGDLIFFEKTYDTTGASHVGIYVGNGMMIHCGNPIQYTSIETNYWKQHFYCFGRLP